MPRSLRTDLLAAALLLLATPAAVPAAEAAAGHGCAACAAKGAPAAAAPAPEAGAGVTLVDEPLLDQDGRTVRLPELVGDRLVVVDFIFTTCTTVCPILSAKLARLQARLGDRVGREVLLLSVSIDPARDTPARLKAFAARFGAGPGWTWLTGEVPAVERALKGLGGYAARPADHGPLVLAGDGRTGRWSRFNGYPEPAALEAHLDGLVAARRATASSAGAP